MRDFLKFQHNFFFGYFILFGTAHLVDYDYQRKFSGKFPIYELLGNLTGIVVVVSYNLYIGNLLVTVLDEGCID